MGEFLGMSLTTFGLVVGWLNAISALWGTIAICKAWTQFDKLVTRLRKQYEISDTDGDDRRFESSVYSLVCFVFVVNGIGGIADVLLIVGINKRRSDYMVLFLILMGLTIAVAFTGFCFFIIKRSSAFCICAWILLVACLMFYPIFLLYTEIHDESINKAA